MTLLNGLLLIGFGFLVGFCCALISKRWKAEIDWNRKESFRQGYIHGWLARHAKNELRRDWAKFTFSDEFIESFNEQMRENRLPPPYDSK